MSHVRRPYFLAVGLLFLVTGLVSGCASRADDGDHTLVLAPLADLPSFAQKAPVIVQQAYQFAVANPELLKQLPCYCGCGAMGHTSNYACYVAGEASDGTITYDPHAVGCSICVDITQDAMRLLKQGKSAPEIRAYIDTTYARYGPSNMP